MNLTFVLLTASRCRQLGAALVIGLSTLVAGGTTLADLPEDAASLDSATLRAAYLACDELTRHTSVGTGLMARCAGVADVLLHRDFGGVLERQLAWWRAERERALTGAGTQMPAGANLAPERRQR